MLQQTQVAAVIPYYESFLERFPNVNRLAAAALPEVLSLWKGLGYYARARGLHRAAKEIVRRGGTLPRTAAQLRELPGFGAYTAGAVASIAFGERTPLVDGNVARVLSRHAALRESPQSTVGKAQLWKLADQLVPANRPGDFNQALMELGALVCTPRRPTCLLCPVQRDCLARKRGLVDLLPTRAGRKAKKRLNLTIALVRRRGRILVARRIESGLFGGLWELPSVLGASSNPTRLTETLAMTLGVRLRPGHLVATLERTLTHRNLTLRVFDCELIGGRLSPRETYLEARFVSREALGRLGMSSAMIAAIEAALGQPPWVTPPSS